MKLLKIPMFLGLLAAVAATAGARPPKNRGDQDAPPPPPLMFGVIDEDHDGVLSAKELEAAAEALVKLDADKDGEITMKEAHTPPPREKGDKAPPEKNHSLPPRPAPPLVKALDTNGDGSLSPEEMEQAPESLKTLDKDADGTLSPEELRPQGPPPPKAD